MKASFTRRRVAVMSLLLIIAVISMVAGMILESELEGTWSFLCEIEGIPKPDEVIQVADTMYLAVRKETIRVFRSYDGCSWTEVGSPAPEHEIWSCSISLFEIPDGRLGIAWEETDPDTDKKPRSTFFWNSFDGNTWSEPQFLLHRDERTTLKDAIALEDGALLLMWKEPLVHYIERGDRTVQVSGCDLVYRAYINNDELLVERVIEPEDPFLCSIDGISFVNDGEGIWCVFEQWEDRRFFYKSWSEDGRNWSPPETFHIPGGSAGQMLLTPQGEIANFLYFIGENNLFVLKSTDWKNWSREDVLRTEADIARARIASNGRKMWGIVRVGEDTYFAHPSPESKQEYQETIYIVKMLKYLALLCIAAIILYFFSRIRKNNSSKTPKNKEDVGSSENKSMMKSS